MRTPLRLSSRSINQGRTARADHPGGGLLSEYPVKGKAPSDVLLRKQEPRVQRATPVALGSCFRRNTCPYRIGWLTNAASAGQFSGLGVAGSARSAASSARAAARSAWNAAWACTAASVEADVIRPASTAVALCTPHTMRLSP